MSHPESHRYMLGANRVPGLPHVRLVIASNPCAEFLAILGLSFSVGTVSVTKGKQKGRVRDMPS